MAQRPQRRLANSHIVVLVLEHRDHGVCVLRGRQFQLAQGEQCRSAHVPIGVFEAREQSVGVLREHRRL